MRKDEEIVETSAIEGKDKGSRHLIVGLAIALLLSLGILIWALIGWGQDKDEQANAGANLAAEVQAACDDATLKKELNGLGLCDSADKAAEVIQEGPQGKTGETGPPPTAAQVLLAVQSYCGGGACTPSGPTQGQVNAAVARFCSGDQCQGLPGEDATGEPGEDATGEPGPGGATGPAGPEGQQGPGPSAEQIKAAVNTYCGENNNCQGPSGPAGEDAKPFTFTFVVKGNPPISEDQTYTFKCDKGSETCVQQ